MNKTAILPTIAEDTEKEECSVFYYKKGMMVYDPYETDPEVMFGIVLEDSQKMEVAAIWEAVWEDFEYPRDGIPFICEWGHLVRMTVLDCYLMGKQIPTKQSDGTYKVTSECDR